jgi:hypothetical protein
LTEHDQSGPFEDQQNLEMQLVDEVASATLDALDAAGRKLSEVRIFRMTEGLYQITIVEHGGLASPAIYTWSEGEVEEIEPAQDLSGNTVGI